MSDSSASAWWQLLRAGNVFTALSNILAGFLLARGAWQPLLPLVLLMLSSAAFYLAGMVLNDVFDLELDRQERPERPLPSGRIEPALAKLVGWGLVLEGLSGAALASWLLESWLPLIMASLLTLAIVGYDAILKSTALGPWTMGACRVLNVLLGASVVEHSPSKNAAYLYALLLGLYTAGLTLLARNEASDSEPGAIKLAGYVAQVGVVAMAGISLLVQVPKYGWFLAWLACLTATRVATYEAYLYPQPKQVQRSVSRLITLFIPLDALVSAAAAGWIAGIVVLSLLVPTFVATRRIAMT